MTVTEIARTLNQDSNYVNRLFGLKTKEEEEGKNTATAAPSQNPARAAAPPPNWSVIPSKNTSPRMSDEEFENAYRELARKNLEAGGDKYKDQMKQLKLEYVSVASPDRKAWFANGTAQMVKTGTTSKDAPMHYNPSGMWFYKQTGAERERSDKLQNIYFEEAEKYEAVHGKPPASAGQVEHFA